MQSTTSRAQYFRGDIEGLRAIAVLLVLGAHFSIAGLASGFIGVEIFFVISGYLITSILVREYSVSGRINFQRFYANRLRRLFPALATMLIVTSIQAYKLLPATQNLVQSKAAAMAAAWLSNVYFLFADVDYFSAETTKNAFLHTWSLGVEEQFYLFWPILLLLTFKLATARYKKISLSIILILVAVTSSIACMVISKSWSAFSFYMMPTRAWQFAAGALIWILSNHKDVSKNINDSVGLVGFVLLITALIIIKSDSVYPSLLALLPTAAACSFLWAGGFSNSVIHRLLSLAPLQWIGRISYSLYLWHWPVLILGEQLQPIRGVFSHTILAISISLLLAVATHYIVENPIRFGRFKQVQARYQIGVVVCIMVLLNSQFLRWNMHSQELLKNNQNAIFIKATQDVPSFYKDGCDDWYHSDEVKPCGYGSSTTKKVAVLWGDSVGAQWFPTLVEMYNPNEWEIIVLTKSSCPMVDEPFFYQRIGREYTECSRWRSKSIAWLRNRQIDALFIGSTASPPFTDRQWEQGTQGILKQLSTIPNVYLIEANPTLGFNGPECLMLNPVNKCSHDADNSSYTHVARILKDTTQKFNNVHWIETASFVCPNHQCNAMHNKVIVYRDNQHLTATFAASAAIHFNKQLNKNG
ncbi:MAG: acyltransferase family protein [Candidatus Saccharimonadales bacterium]